tara:strand:+ start:393 stop:638 length:246 start_codon:yes stop_codon:yes gene_type:complete
MGIITTDENTVWCVELYEEKKLENIFCFQDEKLANGFYSYLRRHQCKARLVISDFDKLMRKHGRVIFSDRISRIRDLALAN